MLPKTPPRYHQLPPNHKHNQQFNSYNSSQFLDKSRQTVRNQSLDIDIQGGENKQKKQIIKLRERIMQIQNENMELHKLSIEQQTQLKIWMDKARRLNEEMIKMQEQSIKQVYHSNDEYLAKQVQILREQVKQLANSKINLQERINVQHEKNYQLELKIQGTQQKDQKIHELEGKIDQAQQCIYKLKASNEKLQTKLTKKQLNLNQLESQNQYLRQQLQTKLNQIQEEKLELANKQRLDAVKQANYLQNIVKSQQIKSQDLSLKLEQLNREYRKSKEELQQLKKNNRLQQSQYRNTINGFEYQKKKIKNDFEQDKQKYEKIIGQMKLERQSILKQKDLSIISYKSQISLLKEKVEEITKKKAVVQENVKKQTNVKRQQTEKLLQFYLNEIEQIKQENKSLTITLNQKNQECKTFKQAQQKEVKTSFQSQNRIRIPEKKIIQEEQIKYLSARSNQSAEIRKKVLFFEANQKVLKAQIQSLNKRLKDQKIQSHQITKQLDLSHLQQKQLEQYLQNALKQLQEHKYISQKQGQLFRKVKEQEAMISELVTQNQRWKSYRLSEEDQARRQARKYKKKVDELQKQLMEQKSENIRGFEELQRACQSIKIATQNEKNQHSLELENERKNTIAAMDEMETQFKRLFKEYEQKLNLKQNQLILKQRQIEKLSRQLQQQQRKLFEQHLISKQVNNNQVQQLEKELSITKEELFKYQNMAKKIQYESTSRQAIINQTQKQARARTDRMIQQKIVEIQRQKLQINQLQEKARQGVIYKKQLEASQDLIRLRQKEQIERTQKIRFLEKMIHSLQNQIQQYKNRQDKLYNQLKALQKDLQSKRQYFNTISVLQNQILSQKSKSSRLQEQRLKDQAIIKQWKQKYQDSQLIRDKMSATLSIKQKQMNSQVKQIQNNFNQTVTQIQKLQQQIDKYKNQIRQMQDKQKSLKRQLQDSKLKNYASEEQKYLRLAIQEKQITYQNTIEQQNKIIQSLANDQGQKIHQIQLLLERINTLQTEMASKTARQLQGQEIKRSARKAPLQKLAHLSGFPLIDQNKAIQGISEWAQVMTSKYHDLQLELVEYKKIIGQLKEDKQNLGKKYQKYKAVAMQYKDTKEKQRVTLRNTYRFNEQILTHCQNIIRGADK